MYNIYFEVAGTGFLAVLLLYLHVEYPKASESNIRYRQWVTWILLSEILDIITAIMIDYGYLIPPALNIFVNTIYFYTTGASFWWFARYLYTFLKTEKSRFYIVGNTIVIIIYMCIMTLNIFTGCVFTFDIMGQYIHGPVYFLSYGIQIIVSFSSALLLWSYRKQLENRQKMAAWLFMLLIVTGFLLQAVFFPKTLLTCYMSSIAAFTLLFVIETPDYLKLTQTMEELERQRNLADKANNAKSEFLAKMSHEIRTPLNGILGMDEMIIRDTREVGTKRYALDIKSAGNTLLSLINDILDMSKIDSGNFEIIPIDYDISSVLNDVKNIIEPRANKKGLEFYLNVSPTLPSRFSGDEIRIRQIMLNIISNSIKYSEKGSVSVDVYTDGIDENDRCVINISVVDTGIGIKDEDKDKLFKSFQRFDEVRNRNIEGTGLGLAITNRLVDMMGGYIEVTSEYGKGSTFVLHIPQKVVVATPIGEFSEAVRLHADEVKSEEITLYAPDVRILIVDDNEMNLSVMEGLLRDTKLQLDFALSGSECIRKVKEDRYDCILLDQMMPIMNGEDTLKELVQRNLIGNTPVIALTADAIVGAKESYMEMGFNDYLSKPVKYEKLEQLLKKYIPKEKQLDKELEEAASDEKSLPVMLIWGDDAARLRAEKNRLSKIYKCVCAVGAEARDKYLQKHECDMVMHIK